MKSTLEIGEFECRAVIGDVVKRGPSMMCGKPIHKPSTYRFCREHHSIYVEAPHANSGRQIPAGE